MKRAIFLCAIFAIPVATLGAQQTSQSDPYTGVSRPPSNDAIVDDAPAPAKPPAGHPLKPQSPAQVRPALVQTEPQSTPKRVPPDFITSANGDGTDAGVVEPRAEAQPANEPQLETGPTVMARLYASDPDGDIVHPQPLAPGTLGNGTVIRVRLLDELATGINQAGDTFRSQVIQDVLQDGTVLIPAGSEIDGRVVRVSAGEGLGSTGSMDLRPQTVILPDGTRYKMYAMVSGTRGSHTHVGAEGTITPGSQLKRDGLEYGGGVGAGAATGAILGGPAGAIAGSLIGAAAITVHLLVSHPQATLDRNSMLEFTLTEPLHLVPVNQNGD